MGKYALIFEGPQSGDADTLRKLKGAFLGELNFSIDETVNALQNFPLLLRESEDPDALQDLLMALLAAGAKVRVDEPADTNDTPGSDSINASSPYSKRANTKTPTIVFELEGTAAEVTFEPVPISSPDLHTDHKTTACIPVLSSAQSTLLSLEEDGSSASKPSTGSASVGSAPGSPAAVKSFESLSLQLSDAEPEILPPSDPAILEDATLEIHFETEGEPETPASPTPITAQPAALDASLTTAHEVQQTDGTGSSALSFASSPSLTSSAPKSALKSASISAPTSTPPSEPISRPIPGSVSPPPLLPSVPVAAAVSSPANTQRAPLDAGSQLTSHGSSVREIAALILAPLVILIVGNLIFFSWFSPSQPSKTQSISGSPGEVAAAEGSDDVRDESVGGAEVKKPKELPPTPDNRKGETSAGDFTVRWQIQILKDEILSVALQIVPPQPAELEAKDIVAGKKPPLKVTLIEIDDLPLTKVGRFAASVTGPARLSLVDDGRALRAVASSQFSVEYKPEDNSLSGEILLQTDAAQETPLRWVAERSANSRPKVRLKLIF